MCIDIYLKMGLSFKLNMDCEAPGFELLTYGLRPNFFDSLSRRDGCQILMREQMLESGLQETDWLQHGSCSPTFSWSFFPSLCTLPRPTSSTLV